MLIERENVTQEKVGFRRWFSDEDMELIIWFNEDKSVKGFQLCYDRQSRECAFTWRESDGYSHRQVDTGEVSNALSKASPVLAEEGRFPIERVIDDFLLHGLDLEEWIIKFVFEKMMAMPDDLKMT